MNACITEVNASVQYNYFIQEHKSVAWADLADKFFHLACSNINSRLYIVNSGNLFRTVRHLPFKKEGTVAYVVASSGNNNMVPHT